MSTLIKIEFKWLSQIIFRFWATFTVSYSLVTVSAVTRFGTALLYYTSF